jgi:large subunit ribosomal protein L9e
MRDVLKTEELDIPEGIDVNVKSRVISVTGPRGKLTKNVRHVNMDIRLLKSKTNKITLAVWQGGRKHVACLRTIKTLINNMVIGVTQVCYNIQGRFSSSSILQGFRYKMRAVYAHFPINCIIQNDGTMIEIRNFLGEKVPPFFDLFFIVSHLDRQCDMLAC